jgi:hypothetical protein
MNEFISTFIESKIPIFTDNIEIDGIEGVFTITQNSIKFEWFDINYYNLKRSWEKKFSDVSELTKGFIEYSNIKFWKGEPITDPMEYNLRKNFQQMKYEISKKDPVNCYICFENNKEYKTICGHPICYQCFKKSIVYVRNPTEGFQFKCGICRKIIFKQDYSP